MEDPNVLSQPPAAATDENVPKNDDAESWRLNILNYYQTNV